VGDGREKLVFLGRKERGSVHEISNLILKLVKFNLQKMRKLGPSDEDLMVKNYFVVYDMTEFLIKAR